MTLHFFVFTHITSVLKPVHIFIARSRVSKSCLKAELCFHHYVDFACVPMYKCTYIHLVDLCNKIWRAHIVLARSSNLSYLSYLKEMYLFIDKRCFFKPFFYETSECFGTICFKSLIFAPHLENILPSKPPNKFLLLHQRLIPPLNNVFHVINQK